MNKIKISRGNLESRIQLSPLEIGELHLNNKFTDKDELSLGEKPFVTLNTLIGDKVKVLASENGLAVRDIRVNTLKEFYDITDAVNPHKFPLCENTVYRITYPNVEGFNEEHTYIVYRKGNEWFFDSFKNYADNVDKDGIDPNDTYTFTLSPIDYFIDTVSVVEGGEKKLGRHRLCTYLDPQAIYGNIVKMLEKALDVPVASDTTTGGIILNFQETDTRKPVKAVDGTGSAFVEFGFPVEDGAAPVYYASEEWRINEVQYLKICSVDMSDWPIEVDVKYSTSVMNGDLKFFYVPGNPGMSYGSNTPEKVRSIFGASNFMNNTYNSPEVPWDQIVLVGDISRRTHVFLRLPATSGNPTTSTPVIRVCAYSRGFPIDLGFTSGGTSTKHSLSLLSEAEFLEAYPEDVGAYDHDYIDIPAQGCFSTNPQMTLPSGGTPGQVLSIDAKGDYVWTNMPTGGTEGGGTATPYVLPQANSTDLGGIKVGYTPTAGDDTVFFYAPVKLDSNGKAYVDLEGSEGFSDLESKFDTMSRWWPGDVGRKNPIVTEDYLLEILEACGIDTSAWA